MLRCRRWFSRSKRCPWSVRVLVMVRCKLMVEAVQAFLGGVHALARCVLELVGQQGKVLAPLLQASKHGPFHPTVQLVQPLDNSVAFGDEPFDGVGGGRGANVSDKIGNQVVLFVAHGGDDRHGAGEDGAHNRFQIERPEVFG